ncbi:MAG: radical SAM family heme chaperone HemW [candidate division WOR-3 bacterium]
MKCSKSKYALYLHVPFCFSKCKYCHFFSVTARKLNLLESYILGLKKEVEFYQPQKLKFETLYIGGGTPNSIPISSLHYILDLIHTKLDLSDAIEKTIELNPDGISKELLKILKEFGVNRISLGVQSFVDEELKILGRKHTARKAEESIQTLLDAGFTNINLDLLFYFKGQTEKTFEFTLNKATEFPVTHISTYSMTYERGAKENLEFNDEKFFIRLIKLRNRILKDHGYQMYEISNFAKKGYECIHNLKYWLRHFYIGLGPSASGFLELDGKAYRYRNPSNFERYFNGQKIIEKITPKEAFIEEIFLKIRTRYGVKLEKDFTAFARTYLGDLVSVKHNSLKLTNKGILVADAVTVKILELYESYKKRAQI